MDVRLLKSVLPATSPEAQAPAAKPQAGNVATPNVEAARAPKASCVPIAQNEVTPGESLKSLVALKSVDASGIDEAFRVDTQQRLSALALADFSPSAQAAFVADLQRKFKSPEDDAKLVWLAQALWPTLKHVDGDVQVLNDYFASRGVRLCPGTKLGGDVGLQIDRHAFREEVRALLARGPVDRAAALALLAKLQSVADPSDLTFCRNELAKQSARGVLRFSDDKTARLVARFFEGRLNGQVGQEEWVRHLATLKANGFQVADVKILAAEIRTSQGNDDAVFFAERAMLRQVDKALHQATAAAKPAIEAAAIELKAAFAERLAGKLDRYTLQHEALSLYRKGKIDRRQFLMTSAAVYTSTTAEQVAMACAAAHLTLGKLAHDAQMADIWREIQENLRNVGADELRDSEGRIIETSGERQLRRFLRERLEKALQIEPKRLTVLAQRAANLSHRLVAMTALYGEVDPARRASLLSGIARADVELAETQGAGVPSPWSSV